MAYCITVHSSQGSTFEDNFTIHEWNLFSEEMKYTAITRARTVKQISIV